MGISISPLTVPLVQSNFRFKWTSSTLTYLGTSIPSDLSRIYELNFPPLLTKTRMLLNTWHKGLHSWFGRCNLLKMCILPKYLYLFQTLPIRIPLSYFKQVQALFTRFVWAHKSPRIPRTLLTMPKHNGGLAMPDIRRYYQSLIVNNIKNSNSGHK